MLCPVCGEYGFLTKRWVKSSYYPKYASEYIICPGLREQVTGSKYRGQPLKHLFLKHLDGVVEEEQDKEQIYKITPHSRYYHYYIGHYDKEKCNEQMIKYREHKIKSRPNGRKWCYVHTNVEFYQNNPYLIDSIWRYYYNSIPNSMMDIYHWNAKHGYYHKSLPRDCLIAYCKIDNRWNKNYPRP